MSEQALPKPSGEFEWVQAPWGPALRCRALAPFAPHYFSTRALRLDGPPEDEAERWNVVAGSLGVALDALVRLRQVHGAGVFVAEKRDGNVLPYALPEADIAIANDPSVGLSVKTADCVPILLADRRSGAVAAVHAGWKGTASGAAMSAVRALESNFGSTPGDLVAAVGPSIGACCYEVGPEVAERFSGNSGAVQWPSPHARPRLDLWRATRDQLERAGVPASQIHVAALCTFDHPQLFHSYRRDGAHAGRLVGAIRSARGMKP